MARGALGDREAASLRACLGVWQLQPHLLHEERCPQRRQGCCGSLQKTFSRSSRSPSTVRQCTSLALCLASFLDLQVRILEGAVQVL